MRPQPMTALLVLTILPAWPAAAAPTARATRITRPVPTTRTARTPPATPTTRRARAARRATPEQTARREIEAAYRALWRAGRLEDVPAQMRFYAPGFVSVDQDGDVGDRADMEAELRDIPHITVGDGLTWRIQSISPRGRDAVAILYVSGLVAVPSSDQGPIVLGIERNVRHAWTKTAEGWRLVSQVILPKGPLTAAQIRAATAEARKSLADAKRLPLVKVCTIPGGRWSSIARLSPTEPVFAVITGDRGLSVADTSGKVLRTMRAPGETVTCLAWTPDGKRLLAGMTSGKVWTFDAFTGEGRSVCEGPGAVQTVAWLGLDRGVALRERAEDDARPCGSVFRVSDGSETAVFACFARDDFDTLATSADGKSIAVLDVPEQARGGFLLDATGAIRSTLIHPEFPSGPLAVAVAPDGNTVAVGYAPYHIALWDATKQTIIRKIPAHTNWVVALAFSPDGRMLISGAGDSYARVWSVPDGREIGRIRFRGSSNYVHSVGFSADGKLVMAVAEDGETVIAKAPASRP